MSRRASSTTVTWTCPACERETEVTVHAVIPGRLWGPPENCYPEEGGEIEPDQCPRCDHIIDSAWCHDNANFEPDPDSERERLEDRSYYD